MASIPSGLPNNPAQASLLGESDAGSESAEGAAKIEQAKEMVVMAVIQNMVLPMLQDIRKTIGGS